MALCLCLALGVLPASAVAGTSAQGETALDQALNGEEGLLSFTTSEDHPWTVMQDQAETRTYAVSGNSGFAGTTSKVMTRVRVEAGATVSFDWDISGTIFEHLYFYVDNQYTASCDNEARGPWNGWTRYTHTFETGGVHQLEWRYVNSDAPGGADMGALDNVVVTGLLPEPDEYTVTFAAGAHGTLEGNVTVQVQPNSALTADQVPAPVGNAGYRFAGWSPEDPVGYTVSDDTTFTAEFQMIPPTESLDEAVNAAGGSLHFASTGDYPWTVTRSEDERLCAASGNAGQGDSESVISTTVTVEDGASLSFRWDVSAEKNYDVARFQVDGAQVARLSSETSGTYNGWTTQTYEFPAAGTYTLSWSFAKDIGGDAGDDMALLDEVSVTGLAAPSKEYTVTFQAGAHGKLYGMTSRGVAEGTVLTADLIPTVQADEDYTFAGWNANPVGVTVNQDVTFAAQYTRNDWHVRSLDEALNTEGGTLQFTTDGEYPWFTTLYEGRSYAVSGNATQNDTISTISTTVTVEAGATLFFDWDVCCEKIYDNLYFLVDGKEVYELNSEMTARFNGWKTVRYTFRNAGTYTVTWSYVKDEGTSYGDDVGVLDNVTLVDAVPQYTVTFAAGTHGSLNGAATLRKDLRAQLFLADIPTPMPEAGYRFTGWSPASPVGDCVTGDITYTANFAPIAEGTAVITMRAGSYNPYEDQGYVLFLDADAASFDVHPELYGNSSVPSQEGDIDASMYEYSCPEGNDGSLDSSAVVCGNSATITIPAGVYDWEVRMPDKGGNLMWYIKDLWHPARADDYEFQAGYTYDFYVVQDGFSYCLELTVTPDVEPSYTVTFAAGEHGSPEGETSCTVQRGNALEAGQIPTPVAEDGYVFAGWSHTDPEDYEVVEDITFTANFVRQEEQDNAATIVLSYNNVWADSSGYVILFDSTATAYGPVIPAHGEFSRLGDISMAPFDYVLPAGFNGSTTSTSVLVSGTATIQIPAGVYDFCVANPKQKQMVRIADYGGDGGRHDDYEFVAGATYTFSVNCMGGTDIVTIDVKGDVQEHTVSFVTDGNGRLIGRSSISVKEGAALTAKDVPTPAPNSGYQFESWSPEDPEGYVVNGDVTFTANFKPVDTPPVETYAVTFAAGENGSLEGTTTLEVKAGTTLTSAMVPTPAANEGYVFSGWTPCDPVGYTVNSDVTFTAGFRAAEAETCTVTFVAGPNGSLEGETVLTLEKDTILTAGMVPTPVANAGCAFTSWNPKDPVGHRVDADVTFTARFQRTDIPDPTGTYTVAYGAGAHGSLKGRTTLTLDAGTVLTAAMIPTPVPEEGYVFSKWAPVNPEGHMMIADVAFVALFAKDGGSCDGGDNCPTGQFTDVNQNRWYHQALDYMVSNRLMMGTSDTTFSPDGVATRAMITTILYRLEGCPAVENSGSFTDVAQGAWYSEAVNWAAEKSLVEGYGNGQYRPNGKLTREQIIVILYRYAGYKMADTTARAELKGFADAGRVSSWAEEAMQWAVAEGLMTGIANGDSLNLAPQKAATRAELAAFLMRFLEQ